MSKSKKFSAVIVILLVIVVFLKTDLKPKKISHNEESALTNSFDKRKTIVSEPKPELSDSGAKEDVLNSLSETDTKKIRESEELTLQSLRKWESEFGKSTKALCLGGLTKIQKKAEDSSVEEKKYDDWMDRTETMTSVEVLNATSDFAFNFPASRDVMNYLLLVNNPEDQKRLLAGRSLDSLKQQSFKELQAYTPLRQTLEDRTYYNWMLIKIIARNPSLAASTEAQDLCSTFNDFNKQLDRADLDSMLQKFLARSQVTAQNIQYDSKFNTKIKLSASKDGFPTFNLPSWNEWQIQMKARKNKN